MFCEDGSLNLDAEFDLNENGGIAYTWELGDLTAFILQGQGTPDVSLSLSPESTASDGTLGLAVVDAAGCQTSTLVAFDVLTLPVPGTVSWEGAPAAACSGEGVTFNMEAPLLDPALDPQAFTYEWTATNTAGDVLPTVPTTDPLTDLLTGVTLPTAAWTPTLQPDQVTMELTLSDGLCTSSTQYPNAIQIYPRPRVTSGDADLSICAGDDWTGVLTGASSLAFTGPFTLASYEEFSNDLGEVLWTMPWSEIGPLHAQNDPVNFPTSFGLTAVSDFGLLTCENNWTLDVLVHDNPEIAALPAEVVLCDNGDLDLAAEVLLNPNGGLDFAWDLDASDDFNTEVTNGGQTLTLSPIAGGGASGTTVTLVVTDAEGCMAQSATALSVHSAPAPVNVMFSELDSAICSGGSITLTMDDPVLDGSSTLDDFSYIWTAMGSNNEVYTVDQLSPFVDEAGDLTLATSQGWSSDFDPVTVSFELDMTDGVCASTFSFPDQISLYPSPRITVPNNLDYRMCEGFDWTGPISGASSLEYLSPYTGELIEMSSTTGTIDWVMPWSEAEAAMQAGDPTVFELLAISDFGGAVCTDTWTLTLDVVGNPMINPNNTNVPAEICVGQSVTISSGMVQGSSNGQPLSFVWSNAGDDPIFNVNPFQTGASAGISVNTDIPVPASGDVTFTLTDGAGCQADTTLSVVIHELPTFGALNATPEAVCSGEEIQLTFDGIDVDDNLDVADATYTWSASVDGSNVAVNGDDFSLNVTPAIGAVVAAEFTDPTPVVFELTAGSDGCLATQTWDDVVFVYPAPRIQNSNPYVCQDQEWSAVITGPENLMTLGQNGLDSLVWEINGAGQFDVTLPPDYLVLQGGQSVQTFCLPRHHRIRGRRTDVCQQQHLEPEPSFGSGLRGDRGRHKWPCRRLGDVRRRGFDAQFLRRPKRRHGILLLAGGRRLPAPNQRGRRVFHRRASAEPPHLGHRGDWRGHSGVLGLQLHPRRIRMRGRTTLVVHRVAHAQRGLDHSRMGVRRRKHSSGSRTRHRRRFPRGRRTDMGLGLEHKHLQRNGAQRRANNQHFVPCSVRTLHRRHPRPERQPCRHRQLRLRVLAVHPNGVRP